MKMKQRKKDVHVKMLLMEESPHTKASEKDLHELWVNNCGYNDGTICLVNR